MSTRQSLAAIHDKDNAHPLGVVGWRSEYHAMRAAIDGVLAAHKPAVAYGVAVCATCSQVKDADEWDDPSDSPVASWLPWPCPTVRAITEHIDVEALP